MTNTTSPPTRPPGPGFIGGLGVLGRFRADPLREIPDLHSRYGGILRVPMGPYLMYLLGTPDYAEALLVKNHHRYALSQFYEAMIPVLGHGLLTSDGDHWLRQRRTLQPEFGREKLGPVAEWMGREADAAAGAIAEAGGSGEPVDLSRAMMQLTFQIIGRALFGRGLSEFSGAIYDHLGTSLEEAFLRATALVRLPLSVPTPANLRYRKSNKILHGIVDGLIRERRAMPPEERPRDFLSTLLAGRDPENPERRLSEAMIRDEVVTFMLAGHETTANALAWIWHLLMQNPGEADRLREECRAVLNGRPPGPADLERLPRLEQVVKEGMRLYPPAWFINRTAREDDEIGGFPIPRGSIVATSQWHIHRDPEIWNDPLRFDPDRFAPAREKERHRFAFFPFGGGQKMCIGESFAMLELQIILATLVQRLRFRAAPGSIEPEPVVTLRPKYGIPAFVESV